MAELDIYSLFDNIIPFATRAGIKARRLDKEGVEIFMPLEPNKSHVGTLYAGALFTLAEMTGGAIVVVYFMEHEIMPLVKSVNIRFLKPVHTDVTAGYVLDREEAARIVDQAHKNGKLDFQVKIEIKDENGVVVSDAEAVYQLKHMKGAARLLGLLDK